MIYFIILLFLLICIYRFDYCEREKYRSLSFWTLFILFIAVATLRYRIGVDSARYETYYTLWPTLWELPTYRFDYVRFDPGFLVVASLPRSLGPDFVWMQLFESLIVTSVIFWFSSRNTRHVFLCITFFFIFQYLNFMTEVIREALAVSLFLLAWPSFRDGKWWLYFTICLGVAMLHTSGFFTFLLPFMCIKGVRQLFYFGRRTIIIGGMILVAGYVIQIYFYDVFRMIAFTDRMMDRAQAYSESELSGQVLNFMGIISVVVRHIFYPVVALIFYHRKMRKLSKEERESHRKLEILVVLGLYVSILSVPISIFYRFNNYLCMFTYAFLSDWIFSSLRFKTKTYKFKPTYWALFLAPMLFFQIYSYFGNANKSGTLKAYMAYYPYYTRLDPQMDPQREELFRYVGRN